MTKHRLNWTLLATIGFAIAGCNVVLGLEPATLFVPDAGGGGGLTTSSSGGPSCSDGKQNGNETGIDCGGSSCPSCDGGAGGSPQCTSKPCVLWSATYGRDDGKQSGSAIATDGVGNVLLTGSFLGTIDFAGKQLKSSAGLPDAFLARLDADGHDMWIHGFGDAKEQIGTSITAVGIDGSAVFAGHYWGSVDFDGPAGNPPMTNSSADQDYFVAGFDPSGSRLWSHVGVGPYGDARVTPSADGSVILAGTFTGQLDLCGGKTSSLSDMFVARLASKTGNCEAVTSLGDANIHELWSVATGAFNNDVFIAGYNEGQFAFGPPPGNSITETAFVGKLNVLLEPEWGRNLAAVASTYLAVNPLDGSVVVVGSFHKMVADDGKGGTLDLQAIGDSNAYVLKYDKDGVLLWHQRFGTSNFVTANGVAVDAVGDIVLVGEFNGVGDFGNGQSLTTAGDYDVFLVKLNASGETQWAARYGDGGPQRGLAVTVDPQRNVLLTGEYRGQLDFGRGPLSSPGSTSVFVAKFAP